MAVTDAKIQVEKLDTKPYKLTDSAGLHLLVNTNGSKSWRLRYCYIPPSTMSFAYSSFCFALKSLLLFRLYLYL